ncbi:MAG: alpha-L-fucosidase [Anaerolineae bacterium]
MSDSTEKPQGSQPHWYGDNVYFGLHYDLHANDSDTVIGAHATPEELVPTLRLMGPQWVQTDCKGHPGQTSWYSEVPAATVCKGIIKDALAGWREATRQMGIKLHCHYSGIWDIAAAAKFPDWTVVPNPAEPTRTSQKMCPRRGYLHGLLLPQLLELIDRYGVDGFWVDGEQWALEPCYCDLCRTAYTERTGENEPPTDIADPRWVEWIESQRAGFLEYVTAYTNAVHAHHPGVLVCSNWLQTFRDPGEPKVPTDWISGDWWAGTDILRCESRFISTRGKPWDLMLWNFHQANQKSEMPIPWTVSSVTRLEQQAALVLTWGGNLQIYENPAGLRDGRLVPWRMQRMGAVGQWVLERQDLCQGSETIPQAVVLHSETHFRRKPVKNLFWDYDIQGVEGATYGLLENSIGTDIMDEWALLPRLKDFPLVVAPEQNGMSQLMADALISYVEQGGRLLVTGADAYERFGADFLGAQSVAVEDKAQYMVPTAGGTVQLGSVKWRLLATTTGRALGLLGKTPLPDAELTSYPAAVINQAGRGQVLYVPMELFHFFQHTRYPMVREWLGELVAALAPRFSIRVKAPACVDVILRRKGQRTIIHLVNLAQEMPNFQNQAANIPPVGPVVIEYDAPELPQRVSLAYEDGALMRDYRTVQGGSGTLAIGVAQVGIHCAVVIE